MSSLIPFWLDGKRPQLLPSVLCGFLVNQHFNWLSAVSVSLIVAVVVGSFTPSNIFVVGRLPKSLYMEEDPYEEFAREHGEAPGRTRGIRSGKAAQRKCRRTFAIVWRRPGSGGDCPLGWSGETSPHGKDLGAESGFYRRRCLTCGVSRASEVAQ